jgi:uncharacterized protein (DUF849 family)
MRDKVIVTCAVTGSINIPSMSDYLPISPEQIADDAIKACDAGAAVVHIHARDPKTGAPSSDLNVMREIVTKIKEESNVVICITTGAGLGMRIEERVAVVPEFKPEMSSFNMGSMNFALFPVAEKIKEYKYPWEKSYIVGTKDLVFKNTFKNLEYICKTMKKYDTKPELECYDVGQIYNAAFLVREGILDLPVHIQFVTGILGGIQSTPYDLMHMKNTADRLFGDNYTWSTIAAGRDEFPICTMGMILSGHVRVGMEDNLWLKKEVMAKSNAELVKNIVEIADRLSYEVATPDDARKMLGLKGKDRVNF